jgi:hypothetical protein
MSIQFQDSSDYLEDMEQLDDLMPALPATQTAAPVQYELELEEDAKPAPLRKPEASAPRQADEIAIEQLKHELILPKNAPAEVQADGPRDDGWGESSGQAKTSSSWFGSGGKAPKSEDDEKRELLDRIAAYRSTWPWLDDKITFPANLHKKSVEKLRVVLEECSAKVQNKNMTSMLGIVFSTVLCSIENLCTKQFGWADLRGFALECEQDQAIKDSIREIEIKYWASSKAMAPEARLAVALLQKLVLVTNRNRGQRLLLEVSKRQLDPEALSGFEDL